MMIAGVGEDRHQFRAVFGADGAQQANQRQGGLLLHQIGAQRLAHNGLVAGEVQQVVGDLKGDAQVVAVAGQGFADCRLGPRVVRAQPTTAGRQRGRLAGDDLEIIGLGQIEVAAALDLPQLALAHVPGRLADDPAGKDVVQRTGHAHGPGEQVVAQENAGLVIPAGVDRVEMAADRGFVQDVVVDQRGGVDQLGDHRQGGVFGPDSATGRGRQQHQGRPEPLPAQPEAVLHQPVHEGIVAGKLPPQEGFDLVEFSGHRRVQSAEIRRNSHL